MNKLLLILLILVSGTVSAQSSLIADANGARMVSATGDGNVVITQCSNYGDSINCSTNTYTYKELEDMNARAEDKDHVFSNAEKARVFNNIVSLMSQTPTVQSNPSLLASFNKCTDNINLSSYSADCIKIYNTVAEAYNRDGIGGNLVADDDKVELLK